MNQEIELLKLLYPTFPREFANPQRWTVNSGEELLGCINRYNSHTACFTSVYAYHKENRTPIIDKVFIDIDNKDGNGLENTKKIHKWLLEKDLKHIVLFSGRGFHIYVFTYPSNSEDELGGFVRYVEKETGAETDHQVIGQFSRVARVPYTLNIKSMRYCIPLTELDLESKYYEHICNEAKQQFRYVEIFGNKLLELSGYAKHNEHDKCFSFDIDDKIIKNINIDSLLKTLPKCIAYHLKKGNPNHHERGIIISYFIEMGYTPDDIKQILGKYLNNDKFIHCTGSICQIHNGKRCEDQISYLWRKCNNDNWFFPSKETLQKRGFCKWDDCKHNIYVK